MVQYFDLIRHMGVGWVLYRGSYAVRRRLGGLCRGSPCSEWDSLSAPDLRLSFRRGGDSSPPSWGNACVEEAERILRGEFRVFSDRYVNAGFPPDWFRNVITKDFTGSNEGNRGMTFDLGARHWSECSDSAAGDIKGVWELSRFPWAFALARAYARTEDRRFPDGFWRLFENWCEQNPPNCGPNWMCGQEATFRLMAAVFAVETMGLPSEHRELFARFVVATGRRIAANLGYALSQKNNHGVSEGVGLITCALILPTYGESKRWFRHGMASLKRQLAELVYDDGGCSQHSLIYHRVFLDDLCWVCAWLKAAQRTVPEWLISAGVRAADFLVALVDPSTGLAPLYGANDGARVLPLADTDFLDLWPTIQAAAALFRREMPLGPGPWDEAAAWFVADARTLPRVGRPREPDRWHAKVAGCFQIKRGADRLFLRCPTKFRHRPSHADMLHVDVWHNGRPVAMDGGSFSYNSAERFTALGTAAQHNVLTVDGAEPMEKFSRFLYLPWPRGTAEEQGEEFVASHDGYEKLGVRWTRTVNGRSQRGFLVEDRVQGAAGHRISWHWRLAGVRWQLVPGDQGSFEALNEETGYLVRWSGVSGLAAQAITADPNTADGWWSPHYGAVEPATSIRLECHAATDLSLSTEFIPAD